MNRRFGVAWVGRVSPPPIFLFLNRQEPVGRRPLATACRFEIVDEIRRGTTAEEAAFLLAVDEPG